MDLAESHSTMVKDQVVPGSIWSEKLSLTI